MQLFLAFENCGTVSHLSKCFHANLLPQGSCPSVFFWVFLFPRRKDFPFRKVQCVLSTCFKQLLMSFCLINSKLTISFYKQAIESPRKFLYHQNLCIWRTRCLKSVQAQLRQTTAQGCKKFTKRDLNCKHLINNE